ncbi:hypothetical protein Poli38472_003263 [Pythium oligandrum]|uniref:Sodium/hydrogen exchanger n=1 Tax=Pythium oligandrum TaxID=41045 RepID=A0A8K1C6U1_PYTOL|nr:hypothetical protein Poli38472_003263 [Pythium oligandrum]|eukprot:TMW57338.1 hypothetical protein Poli38472_003263 [Pythium oligandrum]
MEGSLSTISLADTGKGWSSAYVKADDISAQLLGFTDRSQANQQWKMQLTNADVLTPVPGDPNHERIPQIDETPHCFYVRSTTADRDDWRFFAAPDEATRKQWMHVLQHIAREGARPPRFSQMSPRSPTKASTTSATEGPPFKFLARVAEVRAHDSGKHAEYKVTCHCDVFSRVAGRRLAKEWDVWHRFSKFDGLNEALKASLGGQMSEIPFFKSHRDAWRSIFGRALEEGFLEDRRLQLDTYITRVCAIESAVDFFKPHANAELKAFFAFDENCEDVDNSPRRAKSPKSQAKTPAAETEARESESKTSHPNSPAKSPTKAKQTEETKNASSSGPSSSKSSAKSPAKEKATTPEAPKSISEGAPAIPVVSPPKSSTKDATSSAPTSHKSPVQPPPNSDEEVNEAKASPPKSAVKAKPVEESIPASAPSSSTSKKSPGKTPAKSKTLGHTPIEDSKSSKPADAGSESPPPSVSRKKSSNSSQDGPGSPDRDAPAEETSKPRSKGRKKNKKKQRGSMSNPQADAETVREPTFAVGHTYQMWVWTAHRSVPHFSSALAGQPEDKDVNMVDLQITERSAGEGLHEFGALNTLLFVILLGLCIVCAYLIKEYRFYYLPESGAAILLGVLVGACARLFYPSRKEMEFLRFNKILFYFLLLPPIIFEAGYSVHRKRFFNNFSSILLFAVLGTVVSTFLVGYMTFYAGKWGWIQIDTSSPLEALLFGALISSVDPVATLSILGNPELNLDPLLYSMVFGESVLNDAVSIVLYNTFLKFYESQSEFTTGAMASLMVEFAFISLGSVVVGVVTGLGCSFMCKNTNIKGYPSYEITLLFLFAYGSYALAEVMKLSGIMALFFCGITMAHYNSYNLSKESQVTAEHIFKSFAITSEFFVFVYMGMGFCAGQFGRWDVMFTVLAIIFCLVSRLFNTFPFSWIANLGRTEKIPLKMQVAMWFAGIRGAISFALSQNMPGPNQDVYITTTLSVVVFTTIVFGGLTEPLLKYTQLKRENDMFRRAREEDEEYGLLNEDISDHSINHPSSPGSDDDMGQRYFSAQQRKSGLQSFWGRIDERYFKPLFGGSVKQVKRPATPGARRKRMQSE